MVSVYADLQSSDTSSLVRTSFSESQSYFSILRPLPGKINDGVASIMGNPSAGKSFPSSFC